MKLKGGVPAEATLWQPHWYTSNEEPWLWSKLERCFPRPYREDSKIASNIFHSPTQQSEMKATACTHVHLLFRVCAHIPMGSTSLVEIIIADLIY